MSATGQGAPVRVRVLFFAKARDLAGVAEASIDVEAGTTPKDALHSFVLPRYPALAALAPNCALAVNLVYVSGGLAENGEDSPTSIQEALQPGDELAIIPPISGG